MVEVIGILLVCILIDTVKLISVIFFGVGISILGAIDVISQNEIAINKGVLLALQLASTLFISLSLLNEVPIFLVFCLAFGMCMFFILYNIKNAKKIRNIILLIVACTFIDISFVNDIIKVYHFSTD